MSAELSTTAEHARTWNLKGQRGTLRYEMGVEDTIVNGMKTITVYLEIQGAMALRKLIGPTRM